MQQKYCKNLEINFWDALRYQRSILVTDFGSTPMMEKEFRDMMEIKIMSIWDILVVTVDYTYLMMILDIDEVN
jgi:hypothetical protein